MWVGYTTMFFWEMFAGLDGLSCFWGNVFVGSVSLDNAPLFLLKAAMEDAARALLSTVHLRQFVEAFEKLGVSRVEDILRVKKTLRDFLSFSRTSFS